MAKDALTVTTYQRLRRFIEAFREGHLNLLILVGGPGLAKSRTVRQVLDGRGCWIEGNATAFGMYAKLHRHRDELVVIDDVDSLYSSRNSVRLLKCLCQTDEQKRMAWHSAAAGLEREGIPREFNTKSRVIIIANDWKTLNRNVEAVQDRGHLISFDPSPREVHDEVSKWFRDVDVLEWFERNLHMFRHLSMRHYVRAAELKKAGLDWVNASLPESLPEKTILVARLKDDPSFTSESERAAAFVEMGGGCRATYFNHARRLRNLAQRRVVNRVQRSRAHPKIA